MRNKLVKTLILPAILCGCQSSASIPKINTELYTQTEFNTCINLSEQIEGVNNDYKKHQKNYLQVLPTLLQNDYNYKQMTQILKSASEKFKQTPPTKKQLELFEDLSTEHIVLEDKLMLDYDYYKYSLEEMDSNKKEFDKLMNQYNQNCSKTKVDLNILKNSCQNVDTYFCSLWNSQKK